MNGVQNVKDRTKTVKIGTAKRTNEFLGSSKSTASMPGPGNYNGESMFKAFGKSS